MSSQDSIRLSFLGLPIIQSLDDFSNLIHISKYSLFQLSKNADRHYKTYNIPKKTGGVREISQPSRKLKGIQSWILHNILYTLKVSSACKGFEVGTTTVDNVEPHRLSNAVLSLDLQNFFPTITRNKVYNIFKTIGYNSQISTLLTNICTFRDRLPQGSPCSPRLANLISLKLDTRLLSLAGKDGITYTRYADDLTFSSLNIYKLYKNNTNSK